MPTELRKFNKQASVKKVMKSRFLLTAAIAWLITTLATAADKPNILLIYADDLGYGDLSCYNPKSKIPTPQLDKLAASGLSFTDAHSSSGICTPSRYALLTGRHHWRDFHGIVNAFGNTVFKKDQLTLPGFLQQNGYHTAVIGKWHLGWNWDAIRKPGSPKKSVKHDDFDWSKPIPNGPLDHGFDDYFGDTVINFPPYAWIENDRLVKAPTTQMDTKKWKAIKEGNWECRAGPMTADWDPYENIPTTTAKGVEYIHAKAKADKPFFLYFAFPSPHAPIIPNDQFDGKSGAGAYGDFVYETDHSVGELLRALDESGQTKNTIVIFTADNGSESYAYARDKKYAHWSSEPFRGLKRDLFEGGHHVPMIVRMPKVTTPNKTTAALTSQVDIFATIAEAIGSPLPASGAEDSFSLLPVLRGAESSGRDAIVHNTYVNAYALRKGDWLLMNTDNGHHNRTDPSWFERHDTPFKQAPVALYNLANDIGQRKNLAEKYPDRVKELQAELKKLRTTPHTSPRFSE